MSIATWELLHILDILGEINVVFTILGTLKGRWNIEARVAYVDVCVNA